MVTMQSRATSRIAARVASLKRKAASVGWPAAVGLGFSERILCWATKQGCAWEHDGTYWANRLVTFRLQSNAKPGKGALP
jgi:hypothetical protein